MERNNLWLNVIGNNIFFKGKIILNLDKKLGLKLIEIQNVAITLNFGCFLTHLKQSAMPEKVGE